MSVYLLDTNILIRFHQDDHPVMSPASRRLLDDASQGRATLEILPVIVGETLFTLASFFKTPRRDISSFLTGVLTLPGVRCSERNVLMDALHRYATTSIDFADCYLAAAAAAKNTPVASFDHDLDKFKDVRRFEPKP